MQNLILDLNAYHSANKAYGVGHPGNSRAAMEGTSTMMWKENAPILENDVLQPVVTVPPREHAPQPRADACPPSASAPALSSPPHP